LRLLQIGQNTNDPLEHADGYGRSEEANKFLVMEKPTASPSQRLA